MGIYIDDYKFGRRFGGRLWSCVYGIYARIRFSYRGMAAYGGGAARKGQRSSRGSRTEVVSAVCKYVLENLESENRKYSKREASLGVTGKEQLLKVVGDYEKKSCRNTVVGETYFKKKSVRKGVAPYTRPFIWLLSVGIDLEDLETSLTKYRSQYNATLRSLFGTSRQEGITLASRHTPWFGAPSQALDEHQLTEAGLQAVKRLLCVISNLFPVKSCPMLPDIVAILLYYLPEPFVLAAVSAMMKRSSHYFFMGPQEREQVVVRTCIDLGNNHKRKATGDMLFVGTSDELQQSSFRMLTAWVHRFFVTALSYDSVLRIIDIYLLEGRKAIYRFSTSLLLYYQATPELGLPAGRLPASAFQSIHNAAFRLPLKRKDIAGLMDQHRSKVDNEFEAPSATNHRGFSSYFEPKVDLQNKKVKGGQCGLLVFGGNVSAESATSSERRVDKGTLMDLYGILPHTLSQKNLKLLYSSACDGYGLGKVVHAYKQNKGPALLLVKPLVSEKSPDAGVVFGAFTPDSWLPALQGYHSLCEGTDAFVFRLSPAFEAFRVSTKPQAGPPDGEEASGRLFKKKDRAANGLLTRLDELIDVELRVKKKQISYQNVKVKLIAEFSEEEFQENKTFVTATLKEVMGALKERASSNLAKIVESRVNRVVNYANSMLVFGVDGRNAWNMALRLDERLERGQSSSSDVFDNPPLLASAEEWQIGAVELYGFSF